MVEHSQVPKAGLVRTAAWANMILGVIILAIPFLTGEGGPAAWNNIFVGVLVVAFAGYNVWATREALARSITFPAGLNVALGVWLAVSVFFIPAGGAYVWATVAAGILLALLAGYNARAGLAARREGPAGGRPGV